MSTYKLPNTVFFFVQKRDTNVQQICTANVNIFLVEDVLKLKSNYIYQKNENEIHTAMQKCNRIVPLKKLISGGFSLLKNAKRVVCICC